MNALRLMICLPWLVACGASAPARTSPPMTATAQPPPAVESPVHRRGGDKLITSIGPAGGSLSLDNGARLDIPAGALEDHVEVTFATGTRTTAFSNRDFERPVGPTLEIAPALTVSRPLRVSIPLATLPEGFTEADLALGIEGVSSTQRAVQGQATQTRWDYHPARSEHGRAHAELEQVPGLRVQFVVSKSE